MTPKRLEERRSFIGASELAAVLGLSAWLTPTDIWLDKTGQIPLVSPDSAQMLWGKRLEPYILDDAEAALGKLTRNDKTLTIKGSIVRATPDAFREDGVPVDAKTAGILRGYSRDEEWGEPGSETVPDEYYVQVMAQIAACGIDSGNIAALLGGRARNGPLIYNIKFNVDLWLEISDRANSWWESYVVKKEPPPEAPSLDIAKTIRKNKGETVEFDLEKTALVLEWERQKKAIRDAEKAKDTLEALILTKMGSAQTASLSDGRRLEFSLSVRNMKPTEARQIEVRSLRIKGKVEEDNGG